VLVNTPYAFQGATSPLHSDNFIAHVDDVDDDLTRRNHALLDSSRHFNEEHQSPEEIAKAVAQRHRESRAAPYTGDMNEIPQRLLMPSVHDASLWQIRVKVRTKTLYCCYSLNQFLAWT